MKIKQVLEELKENFTPYSRLWEEWKKHEFCNLSPKEIYIIDVHQSTNFRFDLDALVMFYKNIEDIQKVTFKLNTGYEDFKNWVITSFQFSIVRMAKQSEFENFLLTPIKELDIDPALKENLKHFCSATLNDVFNTYTDEDFKTDKMFDKIVEFQKIKVEVELRIKKG